MVAKQLVWLFSFQENTRQLHHEQSVFSSDLFLILCSFTTPRHSETTTAHTHTHTKKREHGKRGMRTERSGT